MAQNIGLDNHSGDIENIDPLLDYFNVSRVTGCFLIFLSTLLSNSAGIGGGPIILTILLFFFNVDSIDSLALTQISILGGSLIASLIKSSFRHPVKVNYPLIDFKLCALIIPVLMVGATFGCLFARIFQEWIILSVLSLTIWVISFISLKKAIKLYENESKVIKGYKMMTPECSVVMTEPGPMCFYYAVLSLSVFWLFLFTFMKQRQYIKTLYDGDCFTEDFVLFTSFHLIVLVQSYFCLRELTKGIKIESDTDEIYHSQSDIVKLLVISYFTGIAAGTLGIGGGLILNPVLLTLGLNTEVTLASCNLVVLASSISASLQFLIDGHIPLLDGLLIFGLSFVGSTMGILFFKRQVAKYNRMSILIFVLSAILILIGIIIPGKLVSMVIRLVETNEFTFALRKMCQSSRD